MNGPSPDLRARVLASAAATPSPTRPRAQRSALATAIASIVFAGSAFQYMGGFAHSAGRPFGITLVMSLGWSLAAGFATWLVLARGRTTLTPRPKMLAAAALLAPLFLFAWMRLFYGTYPEPFARLGMRCLVLTLVVAALPLVGFLRFRRGAEPLAPSRLGGAAGAASGAWAGVVVDLWCPLTAPSHVLVGHVLPLVLLISVGALVGSRILGITAPSAGWAAEARRRATSGTRSGPSAPTR